MVVEVTRVPLGALIHSWVRIRPPGVGRGEALTRGSDEAGLVPERSGEADRVSVGSGETRDPLSRAGPVCSCAHNHFRRTEADAF